MTMTEKRLLESFRADEATPDHSALARSRAALLEHAAGESRVTPLRDRSRRPTMRVALTAAVAAGVVGAGLGLQGLVVGGAPLGASAAAAEALDRASAAAVAAVAGPAPGPGQFVYTYSVDYSGVVEGDSGLDTTGCAARHEIWQPVDGGPVRVGRVDGITVASAADPAATPVPDPACRDLQDRWMEDVPVENLQPDGATWGLPDRAFVVGLPTQPRALYERARADAEAQGFDLLDEATMTQLTDLAMSGSPYLTPQLRGVIFQALAFVPGLELAGTGTTLLGDTGTVVSRVEPARSARLELVFDAETGSVIGERRIATAGSDLGLAEGDLISESASRSAIVDERGERPAG
jgi:hypothetical protein